MRYCKKHCNIVVGHFADTFLLFVATSLQNLFDSIRKKNNYFFYFFFVTLVYVGNFILWLLLSVGSCFTGIGEKLDHNAHIMRYLASVSRGRKLFLISCVKLKLNDSTLVANKIQLLPLPSCMHCRLASSVPK